MVRLIKAIESSDEKGVRRMLRSAPALARAATSEGPTALHVAVEMFERHPTLEYVPMNAPEAASQIVNGIYGLDDNRFRWIKQCKRCVATMTDQENGARARYEPLLALSKYRREGLDVVFGHYVVADAWGGQLSLGDQISLLSS